MINFKVGSLLRNSLHELQTQKCNLHVNNIHRKKLRINPVFHSVETYLKNQNSKCLFFSNNFFTQTSSIRQEVRIQGMNRLVNHQHHPVLKGSLHSKSVLKVNSCSHMATKLNVRYQSTTTTISNETSTTETSGQVDDKPWFNFDKDGLEYALKDTSESPLAVGFQNLLQEVHSQYGLPWWATIILTTVALRTVMILPFALHQRHTLVKLENVHREIEEKIYYIKKEISMSVKKFSWPTDFARTRYEEKVREEWNNVIQKENTHPIKACALVAIQSSVWMGMSLAVSNLCCAFPHSDPAVEPLYAELSTGGFEWIHNLTVPDSTFILPLSLGLINLSILGIHYFKLENINAVRKVSLGCLTMISLGMIPFAMNLPSGLVLYWAVSSGYGLVFNSLLAIPATRRILCVPEVKSDAQRKQEIDEWLDERKNSELIFEEMTKDKNPTKKLKVNSVNNM